MSGEHRVALNHLIWGSNPPERTNRITNGIRNNSWYFHRMDDLGKKEVIYKKNKNKKLCCRLTNFKKQNLS